jgi:hypothetical protein
MAAGVLPIVLGVALSIKHKQLPDKLVRALPTLMIFFTAFNFSFVGLLLNQRSGKLPWYENLLIAFLAALVITGIAIGGWSAFRRPLSQRRNKEQ